ARHRVVGEVQPDVARAEDGNELSIGNGGPSPRARGEGAAKRRMRGATRPSSYTLAIDATIDLKIASPSVLPNNASEQRSGCGIRPRTLRPRLQMPAMLRADPFGFDSRVTRPSASQ